MSDVTEAPNQDAIAESLVGEPEQQPTAETTGTEPQETVQQAEPTVEAEAPPEEVAEDWLPTDQDKVFPDEVYAKYAERYHFTPEQAADPLLRQLLHDKINSDIYLSEQQRQQEFEPQEELEEATEQPAQAQPQLTREQYFSNLERMVQERTDPEVAKQFHADFLRAFGVPEAEIQKAPSQQAMQFTQVASKYMLNLVNTFMGDMLQGNLHQQISQAFPAFDQMYERSAYAMAWDRVRNADPEYQTLPAYGSRDFSRALREAAAKIPGFEDMQFTGRNGQPLPMMENAERKYSMLAQIASGQNVDPAMLQRAAAAGAKNARRADLRRSAGQLGSGQSSAATGKTGSSKFRSNQDLFDDETMEIYHREHGRL
jgi:hypothetical protein